MNTMDQFFRIVAFLLLVAFTSCTSTPYAINLPQVSLMQSGGASKNTSQSSRQSKQTAAQSASLYWTGDGAKGKSITILPPKGSGLAENQAYLPDLVANELVSNFDTFSDMGLFDRLNMQKQYDELLSGYYADDDKAGMDLGHLTSTDYMLLGTITKTSTGYALQLTVSSNIDKSTTASFSGAVSIADLDNLTGVRRASLDLLEKMGVKLTAKAREELTKAATVDRVNAQTALAQGLTAQRQGTQVAALSYFFQAEAFDASLVEAVNRTNVLSADISTGNIGANVRNDIAWYDDWRAKLAETETLMSDMLKSTTTQRSIWYSAGVTEQEAARDYQKKTTELRIEAVLHTYAAFPVSVQRTVQAVYDGLQTTARAQAWKLDGWPRQGVTNVNPFNSRWGSVVPIAFEVVNEQNKVIGRQTVEMDSRYSLNGTRLDGPSTAFATVRFTGVSADDITDRLSIRIATINGRPPEQAGISQIEPIDAARIQANRGFAIYNGAIRPTTNDRDLRNVTIPAELWGERVTAIANGAYERRGLSSVTIPTGVVVIGAKAFADNHWTTTSTASDGSSYTNHHGLTKVTIPASVTSVGEEAFAGQYKVSGYSNGQYYSYDVWLITEVTMEGANVDFGKNAIGNGFEAFYASQGRQAGIYRKGAYSTVWERFENVEDKQEKDKQRNKKNTVRAVVFGILIVGGLVTWFVLKPPPKDDRR